MHRSRLTTTTAAPRIRPSLTQERCDENRQYDAAELSPADQVGKHRSSRNRNKLEALADIETDCPFGERGGIRLTS